MMTSDDKVGGWVKKGQNHDDVILEWSLINRKSKIAEIETVEIKLEIKLVNQQKSFFQHRYL
jgi:hypothetical protein